MNKSSNAVLNPFSLYFLFLLGTTIYYSCYYSSTRFFKCIGYCIGFDLIVIALAFIFHKLLPKGLIGKFIQFVILLFPFIIYLIHICFHNFHHTNLNADHILALLQTNLSEMRQYIISDFISFIVFLGCVFFISFFIIWSISYPIQKISLKNQILVLFLGYLLFIGVDFPKLFFPFQQSILVMKELNQWKKELIYLNTKISQNISPKDEEIIVVVIGESQNRQHMSAYGYTKNTTPWLLENIKNNAKGELVLLNEAYSCHTHTVQTLSYALTSKNSYDNRDLKNCLSIIDVSKKLGSYTTWWISNQKKVGLYNSIISFLASNADHVIWANNSFSFKDPYDEIIFKYLPSVDQLKTGRHLVFIHLMGNHLVYGERYPEKWNKFGENLIGSYDNSILYNDYIVENIYNHFSKMKNFSAMIYFSDHADSVEDGRFHESARFSWNMTKIPFWIFFSSDYIKKHPDIYSNIKKNQKKAFTNDLMFDTLMGILGIKDTPLYMPENDFSNAKYKYDKSNLATLHGEKPLIEEFQNPSIFWLHRVNSPRKLKELGDKYKGLELDIIYHEKENEFENSHDVMSLKEFPLIKTLNAYSELSYKPSLWFDFKNLTIKNAKFALKRLEIILKEYNIDKNNVWLEASDIQALSLFTKAGWKTSYYVPYYNLKSLTRAEIQKIKQEIQNISFSEKVKSISFDGQYYSFIKSIKLNPNISLLTWFHTLDINQFMQHSEYKKILSDDQIKVILIKEIGHHHR